MTGRPAVLASQVEEVQEYVHRQVKAALHAHSDAVRIVTEIGVWVSTQQHLISICTTQDCADCAARASMLASLHTLLPRTSGERREEDTHGHASDARRRPGAVEPDA
jgi:hypothetical protein